MAHFMIYSPGSLSVVACPAQRQSAEVVRKVMAALAQLEIKLKVDNVYGIELENGSRVLALPSSDDSNRGLTVDGWIVADEAARVPVDLFSALRPMRARRPQARFAMCRPPGAGSIHFWNDWASEDPCWIRLQATVDDVCGLYTAEQLEQDRRALGEAGLQPGISRHSGRRRVSPFGCDLFERATQIRTPFGAKWSGVPTRRGAGANRTKSVSVSARIRRLAMIYPPDHVNTWPVFKPLIIAHGTQSRPHPRFQRFQPDYRSGDSTQNCLLAAGPRFLPCAVSMFIRGRGLLRRASKVCE
jgi:hypothetical protein